MKPVRRRDARYWIKFLALYILAAVIALYVIVPVVLSYFFAHPRRYPVCCTTPADFGWSYETVTFLAGDGVRLSSWYIPSQNGAAVIANITPRPIFLVATGTGAELEDNRRFYELAGEPKTLWELPEATHINGILSHAEVYRQKMVTFFDQALLTGQ